MAGQTVEINDGVFCEHLKEVCEECGFDGREENDTFYGFDPSDRDPLEVPTTTQNKEGKYQCKKHGQSGCVQCFGWKKQILKIHKEAKKAGRK